MGILPIWYANGVNRYNEIVMNSGDAIFTAALDGSVTFWNDGAVALLGYTADEIVGQHIKVLIPPGEHQFTFDIWKRIVNGETIPPISTHRIHKNGTYVAVSLRIMPIRDEGGHIVELGGIVREESARVSIDGDGHEDLDSFIESMSFGIVAFSMDHRVMSVNRRMIELFPSVPADWLGATASDLIEAGATLVTDEATYRATTAMRMSEHVKGVDVLELKDGRTMRRHYMVWRKRSGRLFAHLWLFEEIPR